MKKIFRNLTFGLLLCAGAFTAACSDVEDAMDEIPYNRVLTPLNFEAEVIASAGTDITFKWSSVANAEAYLLELFEAQTSVSQEGKEEFLAPDYDTATPYDSFEVAADQVPFVVRNLAVDMTFYARVRGVSNEVDYSHWAYLTEPVSTSAVRSMLNPEVAERTESSVTLAWDAAEDKLDLTSVRYELVVPVEGVTATTVTLTEEQKQNCSVVVEGLDACTNYKFTLLFGKSGSRGTVTAWTRPVIGDNVLSIANTTELVAALKNADGDLTLELDYNNGEIYDLTTAMTMHATEAIFEPFEFAHNLEIYGKSTPAGDKPIVKGALKIMSGATKIHFEDLAIDGGKICGYFVTLGAQISEAEFVNCDLTGFIKGMWSSDTFVVENRLSFDGLYVNDVNPVGGGAGDFIDIRSGAGIPNYGTVEVKNSTFYTCGRTFLRIREKSGFDNIVLANCTFNMVAIGSSPNIFDIRNYTPSSFTMTKCVFLNETNSDESSRFSRNNADNFVPVCDGNIFYNLGSKWLTETGKCKQTGGDIFTQALALAGNGQILADDPCVNSIAGKMYLKTNSVISANKAGDPRWWNASMPEIVRPTELEAVTGDYTWNFTEKTIYDTETIETNQIIDNIRIYAPAEVVMSEGVTFAAAGTLGSNNVPVSGALGFRADGYGTIEVTAQGSSITAIVQVIAGGEAFSLKADGQPHKVAFGDLVGVNDIYVLAAAPVTFTKVAWSKTIDTGSDADKAPLAAPVVKVDPQNIETGTEQAVTISWGGVANAATYSITFNGKTEEITATQYVIPAATVKALAEGDYPISVIAKPTATSTKYTNSVAGEASFKVKTPVVGEPETVTWNFNSTAWATEIARIAAAGSSGLTDVDTTIEGLNINSGEKKGSWRAGTNEIGGYVQSGGGGSLQSRYMKFSAPASGTVTVIASNTGGNDGDPSKDSRHVIVNVNGIASEAKWVGTKASNPTTVTFDIEVDKATDVYVYPNGGVRFYEVKFEYVKPQN